MKKEEDKKHNSHFRITSQTLHMYDNHTFFKRNLITFPSDKIMNSNDLEISDHANIVGIIGV